MSGMVTVCWQENCCVSDRDLTSLVRVTWHLSVVTGNMSLTRSWRSLKLPISIYFSNTFSNKNDIMIEFGIQFK